MLLISTLKLVLSSLYKYDVGLVSNDASIRDESPSGFLEAAKGFDSD